MRDTLKLHGAAKSPVEHINVELVRMTSGLLSLAFTLSGWLDRVSIPLPQPSVRTDELWRHTCFELFARREGEADYHEFNFAPSGQWAAYRFDDYREGMRDLACEPPRIDWQGGLTRVAFDTAALGKGPWQIGLSAVIEATDGTRSYWALAHPPGDKPDFHDPACFVGRLPAAG